ncbi:MAG: site-specific integrase [Methylobacterium mesophilicum]|nr:site-specific integrase [Methylobacterium mesophilicum]
MASIRKRGTKWQVQIRVAGQLSVTKSFSKRDLAVSWARQKEAEAETVGIHPSSRLLQSTTLDHLLDRYVREITPTKRGSQSESYSVKTIRLNRIAKLPLNLLTSEHIAEFRDMRLRKVSTGSVRRQLDVLRHCLNVAKRDWGYPLPTNPVTCISLPKPSRARTRRLTPQERSKLLMHLDSGPAYLKPVVLLATETGMRRSEIVSLEWSNIDLKNRTAYLPITKNGEGRYVPLSPLALDTLRNIPRSCERVFPSVTTNAVRLSWERLKERAGLVDFRFHDMRHEAISAFFEKGLTIPEVALISGHKDSRMLFRYTHLKAQNVALRLANLESGRN